MMLPNISSKIFSTACVKQSKTDSQNGKLTSNNFCPLLMQNTRRAKNTCADLKPTNKRTLNESTPS